MRPYSGSLSILFFLSLLGTPLALLTPLPLKIIVDSVIGSRPLPRSLDTMVLMAIKGSEGNLLAMAIGLVLAGAWLNQLREFGASFLTAYTGVKILRQFRAYLFRHLQPPSSSSHDGKVTTDSPYRMIYVATALPTID